MIEPVIRQLATEIDFGSPEGLPRRWFPLGRNRPIVLDPFVSFGAPTVVGRGVKTANVHDLFVAENEKVAAVRAWWLATDEGARSQDPRAVRILDPAFRDQVPAPAVVKLRAEVVVNEELHAAKNDAEAGRRPAVEFSVCVAGRAVTASKTRSCRCPLLGYLQTSDAVVTPNNVHPR